MAKQLKTWVREVDIANDDPLQDRVPGQDRGRVEIAEDFDAPLPEELLAGFTAVPKR